MGDMGDYWKDVKAAKKAHTKAVSRVDQSPMNPKRWCLTLTCGHEVWVTRSARPKIQAHFCEKCASSSSTGDK
jgi:hypothetical protein